MPELAPFVESIAFEMHLGNRRTRRVIGIRRVETHRRPKSRRSADLRLFQKADAVIILPTGGLLFELLTTFFGSFSERIPFRKTTLVSAILMIGMSKCAFVFI